MHDAILHLVVTHIFLVVYNLWQFLPFLTLTLANNIGSLFRTAPHHVAMTGIFSWSVWDYKLMGNTTEAMCLVVDSSSCFMIMACVTQWHYYPSSFGECCIFQNSLKTCFSPLQTFGAGEKRFLFLFKMMPIRLVLISDSCLQQLLQAPESDFSFSHSFYIVDWNHFFN